MEGCWALIAVCGWWWWAFIAVRGGGHSACLCCACLSFMGAYGQGRGDMESASCQPPVGSRRWWCWVSGVGGNRCCGVAYRIHTKRRCCRCHCPSSVCVGVVGCSFHVVVCWSLPLLCVVVVVVRRSWPFLRQLSLFVVAVVCWAVAVICCMVAVICCMVVVIWRLGSFAVVGVA